MPVDPLMGSAYTTAIAGESFWPKDGKYDEASCTYHGVSFSDLERFARIVAYKVAHNISLGGRMDPLADPLLYVDCEDYPVFIPKEDEE